MVPGLGAGGMVVERGASRRIYCHAAPVAGPSASVHGAHLALVILALGCAASGDASTPHGLAFAGGTWPGVVGMTRPTQGITSAGRTRWAGSRAAPLPGRQPLDWGRNTRSRGALTTVCVFEQMRKGLGDLFDSGGRGGADIDALKGILREDQYLAVMDALNKVVDSSQRELSESERKAEEKQRKMQKEISVYTNQVRDLEYQLIMAASEVTELEEQLTTLKAAPAPAPATAPALDNADHPVFGRFLADFGYKKIFAADPARLYASTPIYKKQRTFRTERASAMARAKSSSGVTGWPGTISVVEYAASGTGAAGQSTKNVLVDGQHRLGAYTLLARQMKAKNPEAPLPPGMTEILVEVYPALDESKAAEVFTEINKAEPCKLIDLPQSKVPSDTKKIIDGAADKLRRRFSAMFKPSSACRTPHMNIDNLRDELFQSGVVAKKGFKTDEDLLAWMLAKNEELAAIPNAEWKPRRRTRAKSLTKALDKARLNQFFLGLEWEWLNEETGAEVPTDVEDGTPDDDFDEEDGTAFFGASVK